MVETRAYRRLRANEDRISKLPDHLLGSILSLLPMKEASRASILSKRWRYLFTSLPHLVLDYRLSLQIKKWVSIVDRLKNAARLVNFSIQITPSNCQRLPSQEDKADKAFHQFLGDIANVKCLQLFYQIGHLCREKVPDNLGYHFPNLRILTMVIDLNNANDTRFFAVLLKGAPCLQNLTVLCDSPICFNLEEKVELDYWKKLEPFYCMRHHLVTIRINFADYNNKQDLGILEFLLMNGSMLKEVRIGYNKHCERWIKTKKKSLLQRRASSHTLLTFACDEQYWF
ncbi:F-box/LRR-repeat protein At5g02910-like isoform X2 [Tasmannia lanceolata]|uniref:F-box/LRR-repeat protein At5g02910-like isoform X2 n=1 Tax=Tasmannia lanceolata TaxID=3420 RepID=UPI004063CB9F